MRTAVQWIGQQHGKKEMISTHLDRFLNIFIDPVMQLSIIEEQRVSIRKSKRLNELLFDNNAGLKFIFDHFMTEVRHGVR